MKVNGYKSVVTLVLIILLIPAKLDAQKINQQISEPVAGVLDPVYGVDQRLVSGTIYSGAKRGSIEGHPYAIDESWKPGSVLIDSILFMDLELKYDIEQNSVILRYENIDGAIIQLALKKEEIVNFTLNNRKFVPYPGSSLFDTTKYCEVITEGEIDYLVLRSKLLMLSNGAAITRYVYREAVKQLLVIDGDIINFKSKRDIYKLYPQHKPEIKRFIRDEGLSPRKSNIADRSLLVSFCNQLISGEK